MKNESSYSKRYYSKMGVLACRTRREYIKNNDHLDGRLQPKGFI